MVSVCIISYPITCKASNAKIIKQEVPMRPFPFESIGTLKQNEVEVWEMYKINLQMKP